MGRQIVSKKDVYKHQEKSASLDNMLINDISIDNEKKSTIKENAISIEAYVSKKENNQSEDDYLSRLLKYIPAEIVGLYISLDNILKAQTVHEAWLSWLIFGICLIFTPLYLWRITKVNKTKQLIISSISFIVWAYALGGPFVQNGLFNGLLAALLLPIYTFAIAMIDPK